MSSTAKKHNVRALLLCPRPVSMYPFFKHAKAMCRHWSASRAAKVLGVLLVVLGTSAATDPREADKDTTAIVQASYIYNIAKLVEWKDPSLKNGPFIISVLGSSNLYQELVKKYAEKSIGKQPIEVRKLPKSGDIDQCHILFVSQSELALLPVIYKGLEKKSTLVITEYPDALEDGSTVNFVRVSNTVKYELSVVNARKHKLEVGSTLVQLAYKAIQ
ncbi:MAG: YfiR family protein [Flavobacteriales bacterium]|nr:YfiR family protein [Flavobacteriales bacterium]MBL0045915.1 YfiR family protein [Flavobacteriales bacterium]